MKRSVKKGVKIPKVTFETIRDVAKRKLKQYENADINLPGLRSPGTLPPEWRERQIAEQRWMVDRLDELRSTQLLVFADYTDEQLRTFAQRIPWELSHGNLMRAAERVKRAIYDYIERHPLIRLAECADD